MLVGARWLRKSSGLVMLGSWKLLGPCSMRRIERVGRAALRRDAMMQDVVPPGWVLVVELVSMVI